MLSAGLLPYRRAQGELEVLIAHPGGPFWSRRHDGAWTVVKGEVPPGEDPFAAAVREFHEETGWEAQPANPIPLGMVTQRAGKRIVVWAFAADYDPADLAGGTVAMTIRGREMTFPEIDEVRWCGRMEAIRLLNPAQATYYERLAVVAS